MGAKKTVSFSSVDRSLVGATAGWGAGATMSRLAVEEIGPLTVASLRFGLGALLLLAILAWRGETRGLPARRDWLPVTSPTRTVIDLAAVLDAESLRVAFESGVIDALDVSVLFEEARDRQRV